MKTEIITLNTPSSIVKRDTYRYTGKTIETTSHYDAARKFKTKEHVNIEETIEGTVAITFNIPEIMRVLGNNALRSKGGKAVEFGGLLTAKVISRTITKTAEEPAKPLTALERYI